jgi:hypothetical protein
MIFLLSVQRNGTANAVLHVGAVALEAMTTVTAFNVPRSAMCSVAWIHSSDCHRNQSLVSAASCIFVKSMIGLCSIIIGKRFTHNEEMKLVEYICEEQNGFRRGHSCSDNFFSQNCYR